VATIDAPFFAAAAAEAGAAGGASRSRLGGIGRIEDAVGGLQLVRKGFWLLAHNSLRTRSMGTGASTESSPSRPPAPAAAGFVFEDAVARELRVQCCAWLDPKSIGCLEATSKEQQSVVAEAVPKQVGPESAALLPRHDGESWPRFAQFLDIRRRMRDIRCPKLQTISTGGCESQVGGGQNVSHSAVVTTTGALFTFGTSFEGSLGHGEEDDEYFDDEDEELVPRQVASLAAVRIASVACGGLHTLAVTSSGELYTFGDGTSGRLGHGDKECQYIPKMVAALAGINIVSASGGYAHSAAVTDEGRVFTFGGRDFHGPSGKLGHPFTMRTHDGVEHPQAKDELLPREVSSLLGRFVTSAACGMNHTAILMQDGSVATLGGFGSSMSFMSGQARDGPAEWAAAVEPAPIMALGDQRAVCINASNNLAGMGGGSTQVVLESGKMIFVPSNHHACFQNSLRLLALVDGLADMQDAVAAELRSRVVNQMSALQQLGDYSSAAKYNHLSLLSVTLNFAHMSFLAENGSVYTRGIWWGGRLGQGPWTGSEEDKYAYEYVATPTQVRGELAGVRAVCTSSGPDHTLVLAADGSLYSFGKGALGYEAPEHDYYERGGDYRHQDTPKKIEMPPISLGL
jgi:alpha-tubulin suppressor-like RCC1 family protein